VVIPLYTAAAVEVLKDCDFKRSLIFVRQTAWQGNWREQNVARLMHRTSISIGEGDLR
jgi:hypothetical protein